jgi:hypothetical protein
MPVQRRSGLNRWANAVCVRCRVVVPMGMRLASAAMVMGVTMPNRNGDGQPHVKFILVGRIVGAIGTVCVLMKMSVPVMIMRRAISLGAVLVTIGTEKLGFIGVIAMPREIW